MGRRTFFNSVSGEVTETIDPSTLAGLALHLQPTGISLLPPARGGGFDTWTCSENSGTEFDNVSAEGKPITDGVALNSLQGVKFETLTRDNISVAVDATTNNPHLYIDNMNTGAVANADDHGGLYTLILVAQRDVLDVSEGDSQGSRRVVVSWPEDEEHTCDETAGSNEGISLHARFDAGDTKLYFQSAHQYSSGSPYLLPPTVGGGATFDSVGHLKTGGNVIVMQRAAQSFDNGNNWEAFITVGTAMVTDQALVNRGVAWAVDDEGSSAVAADATESHGGNTGKKMWIGGNNGDGTLGSTAGLGSGMSIFEVILYNSDGNTDSGRVVEYSDGSNYRIRSAGVTTPIYDNITDPTRSITSVANFLRNKYAIDT
tara:strand:+ start:668 stop:1786 length:1119 start_codon:yes stop_codon:yes gene_type:complete